MNSVVGNKQGNYKKKYPPMSQTNEGWEDPRVCSSMGLCEPPLSTAFITFWGHTSRVGGVEKLGIGFSSLAAGRAK